MSTPRRRLTADDVLTARDVALLLHAPVSTVEDWARRGILPSVKIGRRRIYIRESIEVALTDQASPDAHAERDALGPHRLTRAA
jgi:excisionase family DNA binding protein